MSLILSGTDGLSDVDGTAATPAIRGTDANTGIFFPAADTIAFSEGGAEVARFDSSGNFGLGVTPSAWSQGKAFEISAVGEGLWGNGLGDIWMLNGAYFNGGFKYSGSTKATAYRQGAGTTDGSHSWHVAGSGTAGNAITFTQAMTLDASGNLGVGTTSPTTRLHVNSAGAAIATIQSTLAAGNTNVETRYISTNRTWGVGQNIIQTSSIFEIADITASATRLAIDTSGNLLVGKTSTSSTTQGAYISSAGQYVVAQPAGTGAVFFQNTSGGATVGTITINASTTTYGTSSDYRLKENIVPMVGALSAVSALKPVTYNWKIDGSDGQGFIAHELAEVCPEAVQGKKDAVDDEGNPVYQGIDTSFLVATLTAAIQEQQALITQLTARITALESA